MNGAKSVLRWLDDHLEEAMLIALLATITFLTGLQVVMRKVFGNSLTWSEELCRYSFMWTAFISVAYCVRKRSAIVINAFTALLPARAQTLLLVLTHLLSMAIFGALFRSSVGIMLRTFNSHQTSSALGIPFYIIYLGAVIGFGLSLVRLAQMVMADGKTLFSPEHSPEQ